MKPVIINLVSGTGLGKQAGLSLVIFLVLMSVGFTGFNIYSCLANRKEFKTYVSILDRARAKNLAGNEAARKKRPDKEDFRKAQAYLKDLETIMAKAMFPAAQLLDAIESAKTDSLDFEEVSLSQTSNAIILKGETLSEESVSDFLFSLARSELFKVNIRSSSIDESKKIRFEIEASLR